MEIRSASENAIIVYFGKVISDDLTQKIAFYTGVLEQDLAEFIIDVVPAYTSLMLSYRVDLIDHSSFCELVSKVIADKSFAANGSRDEAKLIEIPVFYDLATGLDLQHLLETNSLSLDDFIALHSGRDYLVHAIGFSPAFAFLGPVDQRIQANRLETPRIKIPAGSVGIADNQTAVYPVQSSGGWNIIGRTPRDLSLNDVRNLTLFTVGQRVRFQPISRQQYLDQGGVI